MTSNTLREIPLEWGHSHRHDRAVRACLASPASCPFACVKDGGPNCAYHVNRGECDPARATALDDEAAQL